MRIDTRDPGAESTCTCTGRASERARRSQWKMQAICCIWASMRHWIHGS